jgi:uncharacterized membrane protein
MRILIILTNFQLIALSLTKYNNKYKNNNKMASQKEVVLQLR